MNTTAPAGADDEQIGGALMSCTPSTMTIACEGCLVPPDDQRRSAHLSESALMDLEASTQRAVANGIRQGLKEVISDEEYMETFWDHGLKLAKKQATMKAGTLLMDSMTNVLKSVGKMLVIGMILYYLGGWDLAAKAIKLFFTGEK